MSKLSNVKIKKYKEYLKYPYWTFSEAILLLSSVTDFDLICNLRPTMRAMFGRNHFGLSSVRLGEGVKISSHLKKAILKVIRENKISVLALKMVGVECPPFPDGIMYFFNPYELITLLVTEGFELPQELQKAAGIYQKKVLIDLLVNLPKRRLSGKLQP